jgi:hypothetical protein
MAESLRVGSVKKALNQIRLAFEITGAPANAIRPVGIAFGQQTQRNQLVIGQGDIQFMVVAWHDFPFAVPEKTASPGLVYGFGQTNVPPVADVGLD